MKSKRIDILLIISSLILLAGVILGSLIAAQYYLELRDPSESTLRAQVSQTYRSVREADINEAKEIVSEDQIISIIKVSQSISEECSMHQLSPGERNALRIESEKLLIILEDIEAAKVDKWTAMAATVKVEKESSDYRDIFYSPWEGMLEFSERPVEKWLIFDIFLLVAGTLLFVLPLLRRKRATLTK